EPTHPGSDRMPEDHRVEEPVGRRSPEVPRVPEERAFERGREGHAQLGAERDEHVATVARSTRGDELRLRRARQIRERRLTSPYLRVQLIDEILRLNPVL